MSASPALTDTIESIELNRKTYYLAPPISAASPAPADFTSIAMAAPFPDGSSTTFVHHSFEAFTAIYGPPHASLDWASHIHSTSGTNTTPEPIAYSTSQTSVDALDELPFILDTGTTCHIFPAKSDFKSLHLIALHPITGIGGAHVHATGIGTIELYIATGHKVVLDNVLFILTSIIHLVSILCLNCSGGYISSFDSNSCWVTNKADAKVLMGTVLESCHLFGLSLHLPYMGHVCPSMPSNSAHYAACTPDLKTWHRHLGHCNNDTIIDMACKTAMQGMRIDLLSSPPCCNHCILGKQTCSAVPKV